MSDLVEKLKTETDFMEHYLDKELLNEAADKIERQADEIERLRTELEQSDALNLHLQTKNAEHLARLAQYQWVPVDERLPEYGDGHILVVDSYYLKKDDVNPITTGRMTRSWGIAPNGMNGECSTVTHWMPLPELPEGE